MVDDDSTPSGSSKMYSVCRSIGFIKSNIAWRIKEGRCTLLIEEVAAESISESMSLGCDACQSWVIGSQASITKEVPLSKVVYLLGR